MNSNGPRVSNSSPDIASTRFAKCLVEAHPAAEAGASRTRGEAFGISLLIECALVAALLIWPLFAAGTGLVLPRQYVPLPPYGPPRAKHQARVQAANRPTHYARIAGGPILPPQRIAPVSQLSVEPETTVFGMDGATASAGDSSACGLIPIGPPATLAAPPTPKSAPASPIAPIRRSEGVQEALLIHRVEPDYPALARQAKIEGTVELHAVIARDGSIESLQVLTGHPLLVKAALDAVRQWRYRPTMLGSEPVEVETYITVRFVLGN